MNKKINKHYMQEVVRPRIAKEYNIDEDFVVLELEIVGPEYRYLLIPKKLATHRTVETLLNDKFISGNICCCYNGNFLVTYGILDTQKYSSIEEKIEEGKNELKFAYPSLF